MTQLRQSEKALSQVPALALLQNLGYRMLTEVEVERERRGRHSNVILEDILAEQLKAINRIQYKGGSIGSRRRTSGKPFRNSRPYPTRD